MKKIILGAVAGVLVVGFFFFNKHLVPFTNESMIYSSVKDLYNQELSTSQACGETERYDAAGEAACVIRKGLINMSTETSIKGFSIKLISMDENNKDYKVTFTEVNGSNEKEMEETWRLNKTDNGWKISVI